MAHGNFYHVLGFHAVIGLLCNFSSVPLILWFYWVLISFIASSFKSKRQSLPILLVYLLPIELLARIARSYPFIPTETGKYLSIILLIYGIVSLSKRARKPDWTVWALLFLTLPSLAVVPMEYYAWRFEVTYNYLGFFSMCLYGIYFTKERFYLKDIQGMFKVIIVGIVSILLLVVIKSPTISASSFALGANSDFTGGWGSNQVSTVLGFGVGLLILSWLFNLKVTHRITLFSILAVSLMWSLLSFSRGGVVTGILGVAVALLISRAGRRKLFSKGRFLVASISVFLVFMVVNSLTGGQLLLRYQGETAGTVAGDKEKNLEKITSNRSTIAANDFDMWMDNFFLGVGPGQSNEERVKYGLEAAAPHLELTRLWAEHGFLGFLASFLWIIIPLFKISSAKSQTAKSFIAFLFVVSILSTMHSAMRTVISPLTFGLACATFIFSNKKNVASKPESVVELPASEAA